MAKLELYRAKCSFNVCCNRDHLAVKDGATKSAETRSVPTSPNFLRATNINALNLNNKVNQNIQFFTKLSSKTIDESSNPPGSPKLTPKSKSPVRTEKDKEKDKENEQEEKNAENGEEEIHKEKQALLDVPKQEQRRSSKSSEDLTRVSDDINEKDRREIFLGFKEGDLFRVSIREEFPATLRTSTIIVPISASQRGGGREVFNF